MLLLTNKTAGSDGKLKVHQVQSADNPRSNDLRRVAVNKKSKRFVLFRC